MSLFLTSGRAIEALSEHEYLRETDTEYRYRDWLVYGTDPHAVSYGSEADRIFDIANWRAAIERLQYADKYKRGWLVLDVKYGHTWLIVKRNGTAYRECEEMRTELERYPLLDDELHSSLEWEYQSEALDDVLKWELRFASEKAIAHFKAWYVAQVRELPGVSDPYGYELDDFRWAVEESMKHLFLTYARANRAFFRAEWRHSPMHASGFRRLLHIARADRDSYRAVVRAKRAARIRIPSWRYQRLIAWMAQLGMPLSLA